MNFVMGSLFGAGMIGFVFTDTLGMILAYILFFAMAILSIVGLISVIRWYRKNKGKKMDPHEKWLKTGHY